MKFITDGMLGKLTRWLRLAGQDVVYINDLSIDGKEDVALLKLASKNSRILITRDLDLHRRALKGNIDSILVEETGDIAKQMAKVSESIDEPIDIDIENSRCPVCNGELKLVEKSSIKDIPDPVLENNEKFWKCKSCSKIYWAGSHWEKIVETAKRYENLKG